LSCTCTPTAARYTLSLHDALPISLDRQETLDLVVAFGIHMPAQAVPGALHPLHLGHAARIAVHQFVPQAAAGRDAAGPWPVVEPEQEVLGHALQIGRAHV